MTASVAAEPDVASGAPASSDTRAQPAERAIDTRAQPAERAIDTRAQPTERAIDIETVRLGLHRLQRLLASRRSWSALAVAADVELPQQVIQVLQVLQDGQARSIAELARLARMDAAAVSRQVRVLEDRALVVRRPSPSHGRIVLIEPTEQGLAMAKRLHTLRNRHLTDALASWDPEEREALGRLMLRLVDDLQGTPHRH